MDLVRQRTDWPWISCARGQIGHGSCATEDRLAMDLLPELPFVEAPHTEIFSFLMLQGNPQPSAPLRHKCVAVNDDSVVQLDPRDTPLEQGNRFDIA